MRFLRQLHTVCIRIIFSVLTVVWPTGLVGACGISILCSILRVCLFLEEHRWVKRLLINTLSISQCWFNYLTFCVTPSWSDKDESSQKATSHPRRSKWGLAEMLQFFFVTGMLAVVGPRVASLVMLEFCLRAVSGWVTRGPVRHNLNQIHASVLSDWHWFSMMITYIYIFFFFQWRYNLCCASLFTRTPRNVCRSCWFKASSPWVVHWVAVCTFSTRGRPSVGCACCWQHHSAGSWPDRPQACCTMSCLCIISTAHSATAAFASVCSRRDAACSPCCAEHWPLLSLWQRSRPYRSSINTFSLQQRLSGFGRHWQSVTRCWWCTCRVRNRMWKSSQKCQKVRTVTLLF